MHNYPYYNTIIMIMTLCIFSNAHKKKNTINDYSSKNIHKRLRLIDDREFFFVTSSNKMQITCACVPTLCVCFFPRKNNACKYMHNVLYPCVVYEKKTTLNFIDDVGISIKKMCILPSATEKECISSRRNNRNPIRKIELHLMRLK